MYDIFNPIAIVKVSLFSFFLNLQLNLLLSLLDLICISNWFRSLMTSKRNDWPYRSRQSLRIEKSNSFLLCSLIHKQGYDLAIQRAKESCTVHWNGSIPIVLVIFNLGMQDGHFVSNFNCNYFSNISLNHFSRRHKDEKYLFLPISYGSHMESV